MARGHELPSQPNAEGVGFGPTDLAVCARPADLQSATLSHSVIPPGVNNGPVHHRAVRLVD